MSTTPTSSLSSGVRKRVIASPRNTQDLKLRLANVDPSNINNGLYTMGFVSPLTELLTGFPSQLQPLTPELNRRQSVNPGSAWSLTSNLMANSNDNNSNMSSNKVKIPPALDIVSSTPTNPRSIGGNGRGSLSDLGTRKDAPSNSFDVSAERCTLSPSSVSGGRSLTFTPTYDMCSAASSITPQRTSASTLGDFTTTPPPNAPRSYSKRAAGGDGSRDSTQPTRPALASGLRTTTQNSNLGSPTSRMGAETSPLLPQPRHDVDVTSLTRTGAVALESDTLHAESNRSDCHPSRSMEGWHPVHSQQNAFSSLSAPPTPALGTTSRGVQMGPILTTTSLNNLRAATTAATPVAPINRDSNHGSDSNPSYTPTHQSSHEVRGKSSLTLRLATNIFLDAPPPESLAPASSLQSPALTDRQHRSSGGRSRARSSRGSSEDRASLSTESSNVVLTPIVGPSRPSALNFVRGELIGKGSFGSVYRGMQRNTNRIICMKEIRLPGLIEELQRRQQQQKAAATTPGDASPHGSPSTPPPSPLVTAQTQEKETLSKQMEGVKRELALLKQLNHPNIVKYLNDEIVDGQLRIYMEYVSGGSVASAVKTYGSFEEPQAAALCYQLLQGLSYLHRCGIIHRDLKGDNLLLETSSELKIADFGAAKNILASATMTANIVGTAYFMAPEMLRPDEVVGTAADIWSTGCCVIEMLTGKPPLSEISNQYSVMMTIAGSPRVPLEKYIPADNTWSSEVLDFIKQCLRINPASRPAAQELLQHQWIAKYCNSMKNNNDALRSATTPVTATTATTPPMTLQMERLHVSNSAEALDAAPLDLVAATTMSISTVSSHIRSRAGSARRKEASRSPAPREKKSKKDKRSSAPRFSHPRDSTDANNLHNSSSNNVSPNNPFCSNGFAGRQEPSVPRDAFLLTPRPPAAAAAHRHSDDVSSLNPSINCLTSGLGVSAYAAFAKANGDFHSSKTHYNGGPSNLSVEEDDHPQSFSYDYPLASPGRLAELTAQSPGTFLPAIPGTAGNANTTLTTTSMSSPNVMSPVDTLRGARAARHLNVSNSREDARAYRYPNEDDLLSRGSARLGKDFSLDGHDNGRDLADDSLRYGSAARVALPESGLELGLYSALDCLTVSPTSEALSPSAISRRSTSKRPNRGA